jgi:hypothetical protein
MAVSVGLWKQIFADRALKLPSWVLKRQGDIGHQTALKNFAFKEPLYLWQETPTDGGFDNAVLLGAQLSPDQLLASYGRYPMYSTMKTTCIHRRVSGLDASKSVLLTPRNSTGSELQRDGMHSAHLEYLLVSGDQMYDLPFQLAQVPDSYPPSCTGNVCPFRNETESSCYLTPDKTPAMSPLYLLSHRERQFPGKPGGGAVGDY